jgi:transcriptional regulator with XRE-family HTH domain
MLVFLKIKDIIIVVIKNYRMEDIMEGITVGKKLLALIEKLGISQKEFAKKIDVSEASLTRYIQDKRLPRLDVLINISNTFNVLIDDIFDDVSENIGFLKLKKLVARNSEDFSAEQRLELINILGNSKK